MKIYDVGVQVAFPIKKVTDVCNSILSYENDKMNNADCKALTVIKAPEVTDWTIANQVINKFLEIVDSTDEFERLRLTYSFELLIDEDYIVLQALFVNQLSWDTEDEEFVSKLRKYGTEGQYIGFVKSPKKDFNFWNFCSSKHKYITSPFVIAGELKKENING